MSSEPQVFMIESLRYDDETNDRYEGKITSQILRLNQKDPQYYYIRTEKELVSVLDRFADSNYRYLHLSCHGNATSMATTLDRIPFTRLSQILKPKLRGRRLFISACEMVNTELAKALLPNSGCYSILGPANEITFSDAAILWASFYHLIFNLSPDAMNGTEIRGIANKMANLYGVDLRYYWYDKAAERVVCVPTKKTGDL